MVTEEELERVKADIDASTWYSPRKYLFQSDEMKEWIKAQEGFLTTE